MSERPQYQRSVTRADVAAHAQVSTAVVSYVVNNGPRKVAPETAARVRESMLALGYRPNFNASALKRGSNPTIGLVLADNLNPFFAEYNQAIERVTAGAGRRMLVAESRSDSQLEKELIGELLGRQVEGVFVMSSTLTQAELSLYCGGNSPIVLLDAPGSLPGQSTIGPSAEAGAVAAVQHLRQVHGRKSVGLVVGPGGFGFPDPRRKGWERALLELGMSQGPVVIADWNTQGGYDAARQLLRDQSLPESMFISADVQALGFLRALHEAGVNIRRDCPVVSFDGTRAGSFSWPALTSIRQPIEQMAARALKLLTEPDSSPIHHAFNVELIVRESCGCG